MIHIKLRPYHKRNKTGLEADITIAFPDNRPPYRKRKKIPTRLESSEKRAHEWALALGVAIAAKGRPNRKEPAPAPLPCQTFGEFAPTYLRKHLKEGGKARSTYLTKENHLDTHLLPLFKDTPLNEIDEASFERLRVSLLKTKWGKERNRREQNAIPAMLHQMLRLAVKWKIFPGPVPELPTRVKELKPQVEIYNDEELARLLDAAKAQGSGPYLAVLLGCDAGLRIGELAGLNWTDIDPVKGVLLVRRKESRPGEVEPPKGGNIRPVPLTDRLKEALSKPYHLGERVLVRRDGSRVQSSTIRCWLEYAEKRAKLVKSLTPHKLRHTFASRLLARGASLKAVQMLLGHASLQSTMIYLHLQPTEAEAAIRRLSGDAAETKKEGIRL